MLGFPIIFAIHLIAHYVRRLTVRDPLACRLADTINNTTSRLSILSSARSHGVSADMLSAILTFSPRLRSREVFGLGFTASMNN